MLVLSEGLPPPSGTSPVQWHAHEMFFGFGVAVLAGFLLTATKNRVKVRGWFGRPLQLLVAAWLFERLGLAIGGGWPRPLLLLSHHLFFALLAALLGWTLVRHRATDSFKDNGLFLVALPAFAAASMMVRLAKGHTGRPVVFGGVDHAVVGLALLAFSARVVAPQLASEAYRVWLWLSAGAWSLAFLLVLVRIAPALWRPRIDGREH